MSAGISRAMIFSKSVLLITCPPKKRLTRNLRHVARCLNKCGGSRQSGRSSSGNAGSSDCPPYIVCRTPAVPENGELLTNGRACVASHRANTDEREYHNL